MTNFSYKIENDQLFLLYFVIGNTLISLFCTLKLPNENIGFGLLCVQSKTGFSHVWLFWDEREKTEVKNLSTYVR